MREINVSEIENTIRDLCISANIHLPKSLEDKIQSCAELEISPAGKAVFEDLKANINACLLYTSIDLILFLKTRKVNFVGNKRKRF